MTARVWVADRLEAETVSCLLVSFRNYMGRDWPSDNAFLAGVERLIETPDCEFLLGSADADSPPAAVCQIRFRHGLWLAAPDCWLEDLFVEDSARRSGLGRSLVEFAIERAEERGCRRIELDVSDANEAGISLYQSLGFVAKSAPSSDLLLGRRIGSD